MERLGSTGPSESGAKPSASESSCGKDPGALRRCIACSLLNNVARLDSAGPGPAGYRTVRGGLAVTMHPASVLQGRGEAWVVFQELVVTAGGKANMLTVSAVDPHQLALLAPHLYTWVAPVGPRP